MGRRGENIRKRKDGRWEARLIIGHDPEGRTLYRSVYGKTYLEAKNKRMELLQKTQAYPAKKSADPELRMTQLFEEWLQDKKDRVKQSTYAGYQRLIDTHLDPDLGKYRLSELNDELLDRFLRDCLNSGRLDGKGGLSPKTVADIRSVLLLCLRYAKQKQYSCPSFDHLFCPRVKQPRISILSMEEQTKLENVLLENREPFHIGILLTLYAGLRIGELCALQWKDIRLEEGTVHIERILLRIQDRSRQHSHRTRILIDRPKTESSIRTIPLPSALIDVLRSCRQDEDCYLLSGTRQFMEPRLCLSRYKTLLKHAGLNAYTFHTLRHTFATRCVENGFDAKSLSEILGHANVNTTLQRYVHPTMEQKRRQMERLRFSGKSGQQYGQKSTDPA